MTQRNGSPVDIEFFFIRSEEHTSELQSHSDLVCRLLLEKKKSSCREDRKSTRLNSSHTVISYAVFCLEKKAIYLTCLGEEVRKSEVGRVIHRKMHASHDV